MKMIAHASQEAVTITPDGARRRILSYGGKIMLVQFEFEAGVQSWEHSHPHEQIGYVVSGEIDFYMEGKKPVRLTDRRKLLCALGCKTLHQNHSCHGFN